MTAVLNCIPVAAIKMISFFFLWFEQQTKPELTLFGLLHEERRSFTEQPGLVSIKKKRNPPSA